MNAVVAPAVALDRITVEYGSQIALDDCSLVVGPGEFCVVLGPSGCGKTTLLRVVAGLVRSFSGGVELSGADVSAVPAYQRNVGMVFQSYSLFPHLSALENVAFGLSLRSRNRRATLGRALRALESVELGAFADRYPEELSGGQQQRVALARALVLEPNVLLLDEPLAALDAHVRADMRALIRSIQRSLGIATLFVTHDQQEALELADRIVVMRDGRIDQVGAPREVYERPANAFVAGFLGISNRVALDSEASRALWMRTSLLASRDAAGGDRASQNDHTTARELVFRPEQVVVGDGPLTASVVATSFLGTSTRSTLEAADGQRFVVEQISGVNLSEGDQVAFDIVASQLQRID